MLNDCDFFSATSYCRLILYNRLLDTFYNLTFNGTISKELPAFCFNNRLSYDEAVAMANDPLEGFHEVNLASPTSPDLLGVYESVAHEQTTSPGVIYRPLPSSLCSAPIQANALDVSDLPTQPVYSSPRRLNCTEISGIR